MEDYLVESIVKIANLPRVIEHCEPSVCWHDNIDKWMVRRVLYACGLFNNEWRKDVISKSN